jgi:hypothetical protein
MHIDGECHCGRVTHEAEIDPARSSICHCTDCQPLTGSPYRVTAICCAGPPDGRGPEDLCESRRQRPQAFSSTSAAFAARRASPVARGGPD